MRSAAPAEVLIDGKPITPELRAEMEAKGVEFNAEGEPVPRYAESFVSTFQDELMQRYLTRQERAVFERAETNKTKEKRHATAK